MAAAEQSNHNSTLDELKKLLNDQDFHQMFGLQTELSLGNINESSSPIITTLDPLNTAFINEANVNDHQHNQHSLSQQQSQTTNETSSIIHSLIDRTIEYEHELIDLRLSRPTMISRGTMPQTPTMISRGTMPTTPIMISRGTMPRTPSTPTSSSAVSINVTINLCSSTPSTIDLVSPTVETIDLCSSNTSTNTGSLPSTPHIAPQ